jgi:hypothetical protein
MNSTANNSPELVAALNSALSWVRHWQDDVNSGLKPTLASLHDAEREISAAIIKASRE